MSKGATSVGCIGLPCVPPHANHKDRDKEETKMEFALAKGRHCFPPIRYLPRPDGKSVPKTLPVQQGIIGEKVANQQQATRGQGSSNMGTETGITPFLSHKGVSGIYFHQFSYAR